MIPRQKEEFRYAFFLLLAICLEFLINKVLPESTPVANQLLSLLIIIVLPVYYFLNGKKYKLNPLSKVILITIVITIIYLTLLALYRSINPLLYLNDYRLIIHGVILFVITSAVFREDSIRNLEKYLMYLYILLVVTAVIQQLAPQGIYEFLALRNSYSDDSSGNSLSEIMYLYKRFGRPINTFFPRYNHFGNFIGFFSITLVMLELRKKDRNRKKILFLLISGLICVVLSSNRISLLSYVIGVFLVLKVINKRIAYLSYLGVIVLFLVSFTTMAALGINAAQQKEYSSPVERMMGLLVIFTNPFSGGYESLSTFGLSLLLIPEIAQNPILGAGKYYLGGYSQIYLGSANVTDATLFFYTAEYGVIGIGLFIALFIFIIVQQKKYNLQNYKILKIIFAVLLIQTVTDLGVFLRISNYLFFIVAGALYKAKSETDPDKIGESLQLNNSKA